VYLGTYKNHDMLICRQVDDMLIAGKDGVNVKAFAAKLSQKLKITCGDTPLRVTFNISDRRSGMR
jgi:hypothetical protein